MDPKRKRSISIAERAHVVAHSDEGPRANSEIPQEQRDDPSNIVLLCPNCHTKVDKAPEGYPAEYLLRAKESRRQAVALIGGTPSFLTRADAHRAVKRILLKNRLSFQEKGPDPENGNIESRERAAVWSSCVINEIVPNNRLIVALVEINEDLAFEGEIEVAEILRQHTDALESKHLGEALLGPAPRFPSGVEMLFAEREE
ncbi:HNH endonuclease [Streptomyces sp. NPDC088354]|uniref:HNH endonuclease n=1 Tax=Streptomyces sp. NPDC088354 TaxID=3365856 RepID=UPI00380B5451